MGVRSCPVFVLGMMDVSVVTSPPIVTCSPSRLSGAIPGIRRPMLCPNEGVVGEGPRVTMCPMTVRICIRTWVSVPVGQLCLAGFDPI
jgi:hypothetical protein